MGKGDRNPRILNIYTRWDKWSAAPPVTLSAAEQPLYQWNRRWYGLECQTGHLGGEINLLPLLRI